MSKNRIVKAKLGYSLVEVIVSMGVISIFAVGVFGSIYTSSKIHKNSRETELAGQLIQNEIENVRSMRWSEVRDLPLRKEKIDLHSSFSNIFGDDYQIFREVSSNEAEIREVVFTVQWVSSSGKTREFNSSTVLYAKEGLSDSYYRTYY